MGLPIQDALRDFKEACKNNKVFIRYDAVKSAKALFNFKRESDILAFLVSDDVKNFHYVNTRPPDIVHLPGVDEIHAWTFDTTSVKNVYIAFGRIKDTDTWRLKSFHKSNGNRPTTTFSIALGDALGIESDSEASD